MSDFRENDHFSLRFWQEYDMPLIFTSWATLKSASLSAHENTAAPAILNSRSKVHFTCHSHTTKLTVYWEDTTRQQIPAKKHPRSKTENSQKIIFSRKRIPGKQEIFVLFLKDYLKKLLENKIYPICCTSTTWKGFTSCTGGFPYSLLNQLVLPSHYISGLQYCRAEEIAATSASIALLCSAATDKHLFLTQQCQGRSLCVQTLIFPPVLPIPSPVR